MSDLKPWMAVSMIALAKLEEADGRQEEAQAFRDIAAAIEAALLATGPKDAEMVGYITQADLRRTQRGDPHTHSVNIWASQDEGDVAIYLHPQAPMERDHCPNCGHKPMQGEHCLVCIDALRRVGYWPLTEEGQAILSGEVGEG